MPQCLCWPFPPDNSRALTLPLPPSKPLPASLNPNFLGGTLAADVEMLSAQSTMDVQDFGAEFEKGLAAIENEAKDENSQQLEEARNDGLGKASDRKIPAVGNTISEDTKALVKQALMNATHRRQRAGF